MQINPRENFVITHQIGDHTDSTTYYVRAVIRNALTDTVIDTVELIDRGDQRFSQSWQAPEDVSGQGFYISITTTVYTDSGYTAKSALYSEEQERHLVQTRLNPNLGMGGGGGGGVDVDYKKVRKIVNEEVSKIEFPEVIIPEPVEYPEIDLDSVRSDISTLNRSMGELVETITSLPRFEKTNVDFSGVMDKIDSIEDFFEELKGYIDVATEKSSSKYSPNIDATKQEILNVLEEKIKTINDLLIDIKESSVSLDLGKLDKVRQKQIEPKEEKKEEGYKPDMERIMRRLTIRDFKRKK